MFQSPGAILFQLGPLTIRWYGVMIALGFLAATYAASQLCKRWGVSKDKVINCALVSFIVGILGARLYFVALNWAHFSHHPQEILATWNGGLSIHGGILGGLLAGIIYCLTVKLSILDTADILATVAALGQAIGRWGNFFNSEAFGKPVPFDFPLRLYIPPECRPSGQQSVEFFHPTFLYESLWDLTIFAVLFYFLADRFRAYPGMCFWFYLAAYSIGRLLIEPLRTDSIMAGDVPVPIIASAVSLLIAIVGAVVLIAKHRGKSSKSS
jgi:phosphatidylglycerol:prolipoprotein diacylglycerol transferase